MISSPGPIVLPYRGVLPRIAPDAWIAPGAVIVGDVEIASGASVWFGSVVRGDVHSIRIGERSNVQDGCVLHATGRLFPLVVGAGVTIGHGVVLHGCTVQDGALIGIGARILDGAVIGRETLVGAGALVTSGTVLPPRVLAIGAPARVARPLAEEEIRGLGESAKLYVEQAAEYRAAG